MIIIIVIYTYIIFSLLTKIKIGMKKCNRIMISYDHEESTIERMAPTEAKRVIIPTKTKRAISTGVNLGRSLI